MTPSKLQYLGFSGFAITSDDGTKIVIDPFLVGDDEFGIPPSPVSIDELKDTRIVLVSHAAFDHLGQAVEIVKQSEAILGCGPEIKLHAMSEGIPENRIAVLLSGCSIDIAGTHIKALDTRHVSLLHSHGRWLAGQSLSFMITLRSGTTVFHSGDTSLFGDLKLFGEIYKPDVALLPIDGGYIGSFKVIPMSPKEAAMAVDWLRVRMAVPMHFIPASPAPFEFKREVNKLRDVDVNIMKPGETIEIEDYPREK